MENSKKISAPFLHHEDSVSSMMLDMCIALSPSLIWGFYVFGARGIVNTLLCVFFFSFFEFMFRFLFKKGHLFRDYTSAVSGIIFSMLLPVAAPFWIIPIGALLSTVFAKGLGSVFGKCFLNPTLFSKAILLLIFSRQMNLFTMPFADLSAFDISLGKGVLAENLSPSPLAILKEKPFQPLSFSDLLVGRIPGNIGEISAILLLAGFFYLLVRHVITWHVPVTFLGSAFVFSLFFAGDANAFLFALSSVLSGGIMLGAIFLATDPPSSPVTTWGMILYGVLCGAFTVLFRQIGAEVQGVVFAILLGNLLARPLDLLFKPRPYGEKGFFKSLPENLDLLRENAKILGKTLSEKGKEFQSKAKILLEKSKSLAEKNKKK